MNTNFTILKQQLIMEIGETQNGWNLTKKMVENSIKSFCNNPIIHNKQQKFKNYRDDNVVKNYFDNLVIGYISETPNIQIIDDKVYADIVIMNEYKHLWKEKFDNWCIEPNDDETAFKLFSIEVF